MKTYDNKGAVPLPGPRGNNTSPFGAAEMGLRVLAGCLGILLSAALGAQTETEPAVLGSESSINASLLVGEPEGQPLTGEELERATYELASIMRCPVCQGLSVADSPSRSAIAMKGEVEDLLAAGFTNEQTLSYFEQAYGEFIHLEPKAEGFNLLVWIAPGLAFLLGIILVVWRLRSTKPAPAEGESEAEEAAEDPELAAYRKQVRREVEA